MTSIFQIFDNNMTMCSLNRVDFRKNAKIHDKRGKEEEELKTQTL